MKSEVYRYRFAAHVSSEQVEATLMLAVLGAEALHGESQVALDADHAWDADHRTCILDATTHVGRHINQLFIGFLRREFGDDAFSVERIHSNPQEAVA